MKEKLYMIRLLTCSLAACSFLSLPVAAQSVTGQQKALTLKTLTKSNVWEVEENDIFRMWETAEKESDFRDNRNHYIDVIRSAFEIEEIKIDKPEVIKKYEARDFKVGNIHFDDNENKKWGIKKRAINRITDLTYENIHHISAAKLMEVLDRNFGGGWDSLSQSVQDIIEAGFDISTTTLPKDRLHKPGGMYEKKVNDGYDVLEIPKGLWVEAIFAKAKPKVEKQPVLDDDIAPKSNKYDGDEDDDFDDEIDDNSYDDDDEDDFDEDKLTEESYRTTFETEEDLNLEAEDVADDDY